MIGLLAYALGASTGLMVGWFLWGKKLRQMRRHLRHISVKIDDAVQRLRRR